MNPAEARRVLGVAVDADWNTVRIAHRRAIRRAHPDAGGSASAAALVNQALDVLRVGPADPPVEPPRPPADVVASAPPPADVDRFFVVAEQPGSLLARLAEAGHEVGEVVFVDPHVGMLEIVVGDGPNVGQLAVTVGPETDAGTSVSFTLDALGVDPAPAIDQVVDALMTALRRG